MPETRLLIHRIQVAATFSLTRYPTVGEVGEGSPDGTFGDADPQAQFAGGQRSPLARHSSTWAWLVEKVHSRFVVGSGYRRAARPAVSLAWISCTTATIRVTPFVTTDGEFGLAPLEFLQHRRGQRREADLADRRQVILGDGRSPRRHASPFESRHGALAGGELDVGRGEQFRGGDQTVDVDLRNGRTRGRPQVAPPPPAAPGWSGGLTGMT